jgi:hypothetical protein
MPFLSRVFILAAAWGLLWPALALAAYRPAVLKGAGTHRVEGSRWEPQTRFGRASPRTGDRLGEPEEKVWLAKAQTATKKKG